MTLPAPPPEPTDSDAGNQPAEHPTPAPTPPPEPTDSEAGDQPAERPTPAPTPPPEPTDSEAGDQTAALPDPPPRPTDRDAGNQSTAHPTPTPTPPPEPTDSDGGGQTTATRGAGWLTAGRRRVLDAVGRGVAVPVGAPVGRWWGRVGVAAAAGAGLAGWALVHAGGEAAERMLPLAVVVVGVVVGGLVLRSLELVSGGVVGVVVMCALAVIDEPGTVAIGMGIGVFLFAELAIGALELGPVGATTQLGTMQRRRYVAAVVVLSVLLGGMALILANDLVGPPDPATEAVGALAIAGTAGLLLFLSRRTG